MQLSIQGVFAAAATPLSSDGEPDLERYATHVQQLIADGCDGIAVLGTTGEANSFSLDERRSILETAVAAGIAPARLIPGTGLSAIPETVALTRHALSLGVTHVVMLPPFYYKQPSDDGVFTAYARTIEKVGDTRLKIILYHIPQMSAVAISHELIARLIAAFPETVVGIKDSSGDFDNMRTMAAAFPGFAVFAGADPLLKPLLEAGGAGCITATANVVARQLAIIFRHHGDASRQAEVAAAQDHIVRVRAISGRFGQIPAVKAMLARRYGDAAWADVRPPLVKLSDARRAELDAALSELGSLPQEG